MNIDIISDYMIVVERDSALGAQKGICLRLLFLAIYFLALILSHKPLVKIQKCSQFSEMCLQMHHFPQN